MSAVNAITLALELATRKRDEAAKNVAEVQRSVRGAQDQLLQLQTYARDTDARWIGSGNKAVSLELLRHHYQFMERLHQVIALQSSVLGQFEQQFGLAQKKLVHTESYLSKLNHLVQTRQEQLKHQQARYAQFKTDEFASMAHMRKQATTARG